MQARVLELAARGRVELHEVTGLVLDAEEWRLLARGAASNELALLFLRLAKRAGPPEAGRRSGPVSVKADRGRR